MAIPSPKDPDELDTYPLGKPIRPPQTDAETDPDHEANWIVSPTNKAIEINRVTGKYRTKDLSQELKLLTKPVPSGGGAVSESSTRKKLVSKYYDPLSSESWRYFCNSFKRFCPDNYPRKIFGDSSGAGTSGSE